jgi:hypothetical protein
MTPGAARPVWGLRSGLRGHPRPARSNLGCKSGRTSARGKVCAEVLITAQALLRGMQIKISWTVDAVVLEDGLAVSISYRAVRMNAQSRQHRLAPAMRFPGSPGKDLADPVHEQDTRPDARGLLHLVTQLFVGNGRMVGTRNPLQHRERGQCPG